MLFGAPTQGAPAAVGPAPPPPASPPLAAQAIVPKQAVVIVHGMGEQRPMDTLRGFVRTLWETDPAVSQNGLPNPNGTWSKPDDRTGSLELRRITTRESSVSGGWPHRVRTDFYELYWADLTAGSTWAQFVAWVRYLLFRPLRRVPKDVRTAWYLLWAASILIALLALLQVIPEALWQKILARETFKGWRWLLDWRWLILVLTAAAGAALHWAATAYFGRVVRYTRADPDNIAARAAVRKRGLELLRALHGGTDYSRVVLVSHSLGTILAHDLLSYFWAERSGARTVAEGGDEFAALCAVERAAVELESEPGSAEKRAAYRLAQAALRKLLAQRPVTKTAPDRRWLISDFVTFGSPLTHAEFLIAASEEDLEERKRSRELPSAPPYREALDPEILAAAQATGSLPIAADPSATRLIAFPDFRTPQSWTLHHAAPFAAVRWTNVYDPAFAVFFGDVIGGPLAPSLGPAIEDVDLRALRGQSRRFSHTRYWELDVPAAQLAAVRSAVNILDA
jgi:hypothetical protein